MMYLKNELKLGLLLHNEAQKAYFTRQEKDGHSIKNGKDDQNDILDGHGLENWHHPVDGFDGPGMLRIWKLQ